LEYGKLQHGSHEAVLRQAIYTQHTFEVKPTSGTDDDDDNSKQCAQERPSRLIGN